MKNKKLTLLHSVIAMLLCVSMLVGTTFAWFTDSVTTGINTIAAGTLDVEMYHSNAAVQNEKVNADTKLFMDLQGNSILWEPGVVSYENLRIVNEGDLALAYQLAINTANENFVVDPSGAMYGLSQILKVGVVEGGVTATDRQGVVASVGEGNWITLASFLRSGSLLPEGKGASEKTWGVVIYWEPGENDNLWNLNNGKTLSSGDVLSIDLGVKLVAAQEQYESDSFGNNYDQKAGFNKNKIDLNVSVPVTVAVTDEGKTEESMSLGNASAGVNVEIPAGVTLADGADVLALSVKTMEESQANITLDKGESKTSLDVHIEGIAEDNTVPMLVTLKNLFAANLNQGNYAMYHVEDGVTVQMTCVSTLAELDAHNEFYYDVATGDVVMCVASFSEYVTVENNLNLWNGDFDVSWYDAADNAFTLTTADQLAGFGVIVDGGRQIDKDNWEDSNYKDDFEGKTIYLGKDIDLGGHNFNPIGAHYPGHEKARNFKGTFDGQNHTISGLSQNGWEMGLSYSNAGAGLFAGVKDATIKNLKIDGADIVMECVPMGTIAAYAYGECTFDNITVRNTTLQNYNWDIAGIVGGVNGKHTFSNIYLDNTVTLSSLWGSFGGGIGGVIGSVYGGNNGRNSVTMENVTVACVLDVYNDVTSAYQWYAYRFCGMLIGNTNEPGADGKNAYTAQASYLNCVEKEDGTNTVKVYYGGWVNYSYCQFTNQSVDWQNNYPWVREQAGLSNPGYSNARYGHPVVGGVAVTGANHSHEGEDQHNVSIPFNQLYGGDQGVYGAENHKNVTGYADDADVDIIKYRYSITYVNDDKVLDVTYVTADGAVSTQNSAAQALVEQWAAENITGGWAFGGWMNAGSTKLTEIKADNTKDIVLYPYFNKPYTARFVDQNGNVLAWCLFHDEDLTKLAETKASAKSQLPDPGKDFEFDYWEVNANGNKVNYESANFASFGFDVTIYPVYRYTGNLKLTPVDEDSDGTVDYYKVEAVDTLDETTTIPGNVNGVPVKLVEKLYNNNGNWDFGAGVKTIIIEEGVEELEHNSLSYTADLTKVQLPSSIKVLGKNTFSRNTGDDKKVLTIEFSGTKADWDKIVAASDKHWTGGLKVGTTVVCSDGTYTMTETSSPGLWGMGERVAKWEWTPAT